MLTWRTTDCSGPAAPNRERRIWALTRNMNRKDVSADGMIPDLLLLFASLCSLFFFNDSTTFGGKAVFHGVFLIN